MEAKLGPSTVGVPLLPPCKNERSCSQSSTLVAHNFLPTLQKPQQTVGEFISIAGRDWSGCPAADKDKMFRCVVRKFDAVHDFGAFKSAGFKVQEMGESVARAVFKNELGA